MAKAIREAGSNGEGPFGPAQTKLIKFILKNPGCSKSEIHERLFNDKKIRYVDNLIYENSNLINVKKFDNDSMPNKHTIDVTELSKFIVITEYVKNGKFVVNRTQPT